MTVMHPHLLLEIDRFLADTNMGESYFGKLATGNSEVVPRLRKGRRVWPETEAKIRSFILMRRTMGLQSTDVSSNADIQPQSGVGP